MKEKQLQPEDYRINNYVQAKSPEKTIWETKVRLDRHYFKMFIDGKINVKPLPLSEDILKKSEFEVLISGRCDLEYLMLDFKYASDAVRVLLYINGSWRGVTYINYVHQLQNLYYALTGKELNIEL